MHRLSVYGELPPRFDEGFAILAQELNMERAPDGLPTLLERGDCLALEADGTGARIRWSAPVECWRALSLLMQHWGERVRVVQRRCFQTLGVMFDVSRNAVLKPQTLRFLLRKLALLGFHLGMLYTEDTYEASGYPYFGYMRGRYSTEELRALDDYADALGIELCPCIQTLGHLNRALHWPAMQHMRDTGDVLLADDPATLDFIRAMLVSASAPYRSRRIHIGMDEAQSLGQGAYLRRHGSTPPFAIMERHLSQVGDIVRELGLDAMMWSDMYFRLSSPAGGYYDAAAIPADVVARAPADIRLIYWDYYHSDEQSYDRMLRLHGDFAAPLGFAGGLWTWTGPAPHWERMLQTSLPGLRQARRHGVPLVLATAWGDDGAECNALAALYGLTVYAEFCYSGDYVRADVDLRFRGVMGADTEAFLNLTRFNKLPGVKDWDVRPVNASKFLLYQDPLVPLFQADMAGTDMAAHYEALAEDYRRYRAENPAFDGLLDFYLRLGEALAAKCRLHQSAGACVRAGDRAGAGACVELARRAQRCMEALRLAWRRLWYATNKIYGFEIIDLRLGGMTARLDSAAEQLEAFADGSVATIEPLAEAPLPYTMLPGGELMGSYAWSEIVSACAPGT